MNGQMTELEAVNEVLAAIGDQPVQTLAAGTYIEAIRIQQIIKETSREIQAQGWWFNEEENKTLKPDINGYITLGYNVINVYVLNDNDGSIIQRGNRLYDRKKDTYKFDKDLQVDLLLALDWDELPQVARSYISAYVAIKYNSGYIGLDGAMQNMISILNERRIAFRKADTMARDINLLNNVVVNNIAFRNRRG